MTPAEIRAAREHHGWTLDQMADRLGVDRMTVWRWEQGRRVPPPFLRLALDRLRECEARNPNHGE